MTDTLFHKEQQAIKLLKAIPSDDIELAYSGGKDSDVILYLARTAGIPFTAIYRNTTIDPPHTIAHCKQNGVQIMQPKITFFQLIERKGFPTRRARFCCEYLKEYKVKDNAILGIRKAESQKRNAMYKEPEICRVYNKTDKCRQYLPILYWTNNDIKEYIISNHIELHPLYYDNGTLNCGKRLGCIGCPLASDNGLSDFKQHPMMVKQWLKHGKVWFDTHPNTSSHTKFRNIYALLAHNLFYDSYSSFLMVDRNMFGYTDWKQLLEDYFQIDLTF